MVKILIFIKFLLIKIVALMSQGEFLEKKKTKENLFAVHLMASYRETLSVKT